MTSKLLVCTLAFLFGFILYGYSFQDDPNTTPSISIKDFVKTSDDNLSVTPTAIGDSCSGTGSERHDNGTWENGYGWSTTVTDGRFAIKFVPASYPWQYNKFCVGLTRLSTGADSMKFDIVIYDTTGAGGGPGTLLGTLTDQVARPVQIYPAYSWFSYNIASVTGTLVNSGSIFIGIKYNASAAGNTAKFVMADEDGTLWPGYGFANAEPWNTIQGFGGPFANYKCIAMRTVGSGSGAVCTNNWTTQTSGTTGQLLTVSTVSDQIGWAAGSGPTVIKTVNGGATWTSATGTGVLGDVYSIWGLDANTALCTTTPGATFIYKTTNGGTTWAQVYTLAGGFIDGIQMVSATEGYALGDPVAQKWTVLKTTNGGDSWARMATEPNQVGSEAGWNNSFHVLGTHMWFGTNGTRVYHSSDLGLTWASGATTGTVSTYAVHYNTSSNGLAGGTVMVKSIDGGTTYSSTGSPGTGGNINGIDGAGTDWWATRNDANIYRSTNQGANWTTAHTVAGSVFQHIDFKVVDGCPVGWAVSSTGSVAYMRTITGISNYNSEVPSSYSLKQNFPNPFNPTTNVNFSIPKSGLVILKIYDMVGKEVATLVNEVKSAGNYIVGFNASNLPSGAYFYRIESNDFVDTKKMLLIK